MRRILSACLVAAIVALPACSKAETKDTAKAAAPKTPAAAAVLNANCPVSGKPVDAAIATATFQGHAIGFCCGKCPGSFNGMSDTDKVAALAKNGTKLPQ